LIRRKSSTYDRGALNLLRAGVSVDRQGDCAKVAVHGVISQFFRGLRDVNAGISFLRLLFSDPTIENAALLALSPRERLRAKMGNML